jgi:SPP1 gp7 family putative phage head morphogenesis protein
MTTQARQELIRAARQRKQEQGRRGLQRNPPKPRRPEGEIRTYQARLRDLRRAIEREIRDRVFPEVESLLAEAGTRDDAARADRWPERIRDLFIATRSAVKPAEEQAKEAMRTLGDKVQSHATDEQIREIRAVLGVAPKFYDDAKVRDLLNAWKQQNEAFITRFSDEAIQEAQDVVSRGVRSGTAQKGIRDELRRRFQITDNRAKRIARTEVSQLNAQITRERQRELGIDGYMWRTASDERVRDTHEDLNGRQFAWDDPPSATDGQHPGEPVNCRCVAAPLVDDLLDELEQDE